jgi:hypothetical protein
MHFAAKNLCAQIMWITPFNKRKTFQNCAKARFNSV